MERNERNYSAVTSTISRVPKNLRKLNEEAYTPQVISIGPFHHGNEELAEMEKEKRKYKKRFNQRLLADDDDKWEELKTFVENHEQEIRHCYSQPVEFGNDKFVEMILYDAVFIIELLVRFYRMDGVDFLLNKIFLRALTRDLLLLENQLPFFVLEGLFELAFSSSTTPDGATNIAVEATVSDTDEATVANDRDVGINIPIFRKLCCEFFVLPFSRNIRAVKVQHFTDLYRHALAGEPKNNKSEAVTSENSHAIDMSEIHPLVESKRRIDLPNAVKLEELGLKFKRLQTKCAIEIILNRAELRIPCIKITEETDCLIRNVMALEQCHYPSETYICSYITLMNFLIQSAEDVNLLVRKNIIKNCVGDNAVVVEMFNKLCQQIPQSDHCYAGVLMPLRARCNSILNRIRAQLRGSCIGNFLRVIVAVALIVYTFTKFLHS